MSKDAIDLAQSYINNPEKQKKLYQRTLIIVVISQIFAGAGLAAGVTVGALLAEQMLGTDASAGLPTALFILGSAGGVLVVGRLSNYFGRRIGLATGFMIGALGAMGVVIAALINSAILLFASLIIYGAGTATNLQSRYAGTDLANNKQRGTAISIVMVSTTFGAVAGPNLVDVMGRLAISIGIPELAGPFILSAFVFIIASLILYVMLRPDPYIIALTIDSYKQKHEHSGISEKINHTSKRGVVIGAVIMVITQVVMVGIMTMTPVYMGDYGHDLSHIGLIISFHTAFQYLPSIFTGILVDKIGRTPIVIASGFTLLLAGIIAAILPTDSEFLLIVAVSLLGLGWNFSLISGTALIIDSTEPSIRAKTQGIVDVFVALAGASGGALSGIIVAGSSYATLSFAGGILSLILIPVVIYSRSSRE